MYIGGDNVEKLYIGNTEVEKVYLGTDVIYEKASADLWSISADGLTATRASLPMTLSGYGNNASDRFSIQNSCIVDVTNAVAASGSIGQKTITADNVVGTNTSFRDTCVRLFSYSNDRAKECNFLISEEPQDCDGKYLLLDKDGSIKGQSLTFIEKEADVPNNAFSYDSETDTITLGAGVWDASVDQNNPITLSSDVILNNMGGMYADNNFTYMMDIRKPSKNLSLVVANPSYYTYLLSTGIRSNYNMYVGTSSSRHNINSSSYLDTSTWSSLNLYGSSSSSYFYFNNSNQYIEIKETIDTDAMDAAVSSDYNWTFQIKNLYYSSTAYAKTSVTLYYKDGTSYSLFDNHTPTASSDYITNFDYTKFLNLDYILFRYDALTTSSVGAGAIGAPSASLVGDFSSSFSQNMTCQTTEMGGTGRIEFSYGYKTPYYINYNSTTGLESISTTPTYPVIDPYS